MALCLTAVAATLTGGGFLTRYALQESGYLGDPGMVTVSACHVEHRLKAGRKRDCRGTWTSAEPVTLDRATHDYPPGTRVPARLVGSTAHESQPAVLLGTLLFFAPFLWIALGTAGYGSYLQITWPNHWNSRFHIRLVWIPSVILLVAGMAAYFLLVHNYGID